MVAAGRRNLHLDGSFTVELSLLMGLILPVLVAVLLTGFYLHDQGCLQGAACEVALMGGNLQLYEDRAGLMSGRCGKRAQEVVWSRDTAGTGSAGKDEAAASFQGNFRIPGMTAALLNGGMAATGASWKHAIYHPADIIRTAKGAKYLLDEILE